MVSMLEIGAIDEFNMLWMALMSVWVLLKKELEHWNNVGPSLCYGPNSTKRRSLRGCSPDDPVDLPACSL